MYSITYGHGFVKREIDLYKKMISSYDEDPIDVLRALALFQKMDLPYFPLELLALWYTSNYNTILDKISDLVNISNENNGVYLRNNILTLKSATIIQYTIKGRFMSR